MCPTRQDFALNFSTRSLTVVEMIQGVLIIHKALSPADYNHLNTRCEKDGCRP